MFSLELSITCAFFFATIWFKSSTTNKWYKYELPAPQFKTQTCHQCSIPELFSIFQNHISFNFRLILVYIYIYSIIFPRSPCGDHRHRHVGAPQQPRSAAVDPGFLGRPPRLARRPGLRGAAQNGHEAAEFADAGGELQGAGGWTGTVVQA